MIGRKTRDLEEALREERRKNAALAELLRAERERGEKLGREAEKARDLEAQWRHFWQYDGRPRPEEA